MMVLAFFSGFVLGGALVFFVCVVIMRMISDDIKRDMKARDMLRG